MFSRGCRRAGLRGPRARGNVEKNGRGVLLRIARLLSLKSTGDEEYIRRETEPYGSAAPMLRLIPEHMTGKTVPEA